MPKSLSRLLSNVLIPQQPFLQPSATSIGNSNQQINHDNNNTILEDGEATATASSTTSRARSHTISVAKPPKTGSVFRLHLGFHRSGGPSSHDIAKKKSAHTNQDAGSTSAESSQQQPHNRRSGSRFALHLHSRSSHHQSQPSAQSLAISTLGIVGINQRCNDYFYQHMLHLLIQAKQSSVQDQPPVHVEPHNDDNHHPPLSNTRSSLISLGQHRAANERSSHTLTGLAASGLKPRSRQKPFKKHWFQNIIMTQQHPYYDEADKADEDAANHCVPSTSAAVKTTTHHSSWNHNHGRSSEHEVNERRSDFMMPSVTNLQRLDGLLLLWDKHHHDQIEEPNIGTLAMPSVNQINVSLIENDEVANIPVVLVVNMGLTQPRTSTQQRAFLEKVNDMCWVKTMVEKLGAQRARVCLWWSDSDAKDAKKVAFFYAEFRRFSVTF